MLTCVCVCESACECMCVRVLVGDEVSWVYMFVLQLNMNKMNDLTIMMNINIITNVAFKHT